MNERRCAAVAAGLTIALCACQSSTLTERSSTLQFVLVAPLCSSTLPVEFSVDNQVVGVDTFRVMLPSAHTVSRAFDVPPGPHLVGARVVGGYVWAPRSLSIAPGAAVVDSLPFYCS